MCNVLDIIIIICIKTFSYKDKFCYLNQELIWLINIFLCKLKVFFFCVSVLCENVALVYLKHLFSGRTREISLIIAKKIIIKIHNTWLMHCKKSDNINHRCFSISFGSWFEIHESQEQNNLIFFKSIFIFF